MNQWPTHDSIANGNGNVSSNGNGFADPTLLSVDNPSLYPRTAVNGMSFPNHQQPLQPSAPTAQHAPQTPQQFPYNVASVVPSKRPRPADDGLVASPGQPPGSIDHSRSQTPQQVNAFPGTFPYQQHLQPRTSSNATPSPTMQSQQFRPAQSAQRMQTMSPNPQYPQQPIGMSPPPDANGRVTPQAAQFNLAPQMQGQMHGQMPTPMGGQMPGQINPQMGMAMPGHMVGQMPSQIAPQMNPAFVAGGAMPNSYNPGFANMPGMAMPAPQGYPPTQANLVAHAEAQRMHHMKMQQQQQHAQQLAMQRQRMQQQAMNPMAANQHPGMAAQPRMPQPGAPQQAQPTLLNFVRMVGSYMQRVGKPFNPNPIVFGRQVNLLMLFQQVKAMKGSKAVTAGNLWPKVAALVGFPEPGAVVEIRDVFEASLGQYEAAFYAQQRKPDGMPPGPVPGAAQQMSPVRTAPQTPQHMPQPSPMQMQDAVYPNAAQTPIMSQEQMTPVQANATLPMANGWSTPQSDTASAKAQSQRKSMSRPLDDSPGQIRESPVRPPDAKMANGVTAPPEPVEPQDETLYTPYVDYFENRYGGFDPDRFAEQADVIHLARPPFRSIFDMEPLDVRAAGLGIQSGITREVCYALNTLLAGTRRQFIQLEHCEDLLDILIDCAQTQVDRLAEKSKEISDTVEFPSYETVMRNVHTDTFHLADPAEFGSSEYEKETAANQLLTITAILRNLSFPLHMSKAVSNNKSLTSPLVTKFISNTIRLVGTRDMLLGTNINTAYFMVDLVVLLSNVAANNIPHSPINLQIPSREHASNLLNFLLAFAPQPDPSSAEELDFAFYHPRINRYYPVAIDTFAKLLVSSDSNRAHFKAIMCEPSAPRRSSPSASSTQPLAIHQQYALLTRAFGFAIAALPDRNGLQPPDEILFQKREATLRNGLLAADVISGLLPTTGPSAAVVAASSLARAWLNTSSFWMPSMTTMCHTIFNGQGMRTSEFGLAIVHRALGIMYTLATVGMGKRAVKGAVGEAANGAGKNGAEEGAADEETSAADGAEGEGAVNGTVADKALAVAEAFGVRKGIPVERLPNHEFVVGALNMSHMDQTVLRFLAALARLDE
jgi:SWI/SNF chromatin-remodeling complex subunit SWI1